MNKYGVEDKKELIEEELKDVRNKLKSKTASKTAPSELDYLVQREKDLLEALESTE